MSAREEGFLTTASKGLLVRQALSEQLPHISGLNTGDTKEMLLCDNKSFELLFEFHQASIRDRQEQFCLCYLSATSAVPANTDLKLNSKSQKGQTFQIYDDLLRIY